VKSRIVRLQITKVRTLGAPWEASLLLQHPNHKGWVVRGGATSQEAIERSLEAAEALDKEWSDVGRN